MTDRAAAPPSFARAFGAEGGRGLAVTLALDILLPWIAVRVLERHGVPSVAAFAAGALFPLASIVASWLRQRRVEIIGIAVIVTMACGVAMAFATSDVRFSVVKAAPAFGLFGIVCLGSLFAARPVMFYVSRHFAASDDASARAAWDARLQSPGFRQAMRILTLVWGVAAIGESVLGIAAAFLLAPQAALIAEPVIALGTVALLLTWTAAFARRRTPRS
jgi:hypothetical protein